MKTVWNGLSFLAVVNLLALLMFVGWLWKTDRLDADRVEHVRSMFARTISDDQAADEEAEKQGQLVRREQAEQVRRQEPPLPSAERVRSIMQTQ